jgi:hypothetical protein
MRKKRPKKTKLMLNSETIRALADKSLTQIAGGCSCYSNSDGGESGCPGCDSD